VAGSASGGADDAGQLSDPAADLGELHGSRVGFRVSFARGRGLLECACSAVSCAHFSRPVLSLWNAEQCRLWCIPLCPSVEHEPRIGTDHLQHGSAEYGLKVGLVWWLPACSWPVSTRSSYTGNSAVRFASTQPGTRQPRAASGTSTDRVPSKTAGEMRDPFYFLFPRTINGLAAEPALTIYNQNFAVVRESVPLDLKAGLPVWSARV